MITYVMLHISIDINGIINANTEHPEPTGDWAPQISGSFSDALDAVNNRYGEFVALPASMLDMKGVVLDRIAFGNVRDLY